MPPPAPSPARAPPFASPRRCPTVSAASWCRGARTASRPSDRPHRRERVMWLEMKVKGLTLDPLSKLPILILRDEEDKGTLPIWVGLAESNAIAHELEKIPTARPMTHDLMKSILEALRARVLKVVVNDLRDKTFFAVLHLQLASP